MNGENFLGNTALKEVHDLTREKQQCRIDDIVYDEHEKPFSTLDNAHINGYKDCLHCIRLDEKSSGHILDCISGKVKVEIETLNNLELKFPANDEFYNLELEKKATPGL